MSSLEQPTETVVEFSTIQDEALNIFQKKNLDYGNSFARFGTVGVMLRLRDKLDRYINLAQGDREVVLVKNERLRDTLIDLSNYSIMAVMMGDDEGCSEIVDPESIVPTKMMNPPELVQEMAEHLGVDTEDEDMVEFGLRRMVDWMREHPEALPGPARPEWGQD